MRALSAAELAQIAGRAGRYMTGGLGSAVAECLAENDPVKMLRIGVKDTFGQSGTADELMKVYGLDADSVAASVKAYLA